MNTVSTIFTKLINGNKTSLYIFCFVAVVFYNASHSFFAGFFRSCTMPHHFNNGMGTTDLYNFFTNTGAGSGAYFVINKQTGTNTTNW